MKKLMAGPILLLLCVAGIGWSQAPLHWYGYVYDKDTGLPVEDALVTTAPSGGVDYTSSTGLYNLCNANGMQNNVYYYWIYARKGVKQGKVAVNAYYHEDDDPVRRDIYIEVPPGK